MASIKFSNIFEVVTANEEEALSLEAQADLITTIRDMATQHGWSHVEVCAEENHIVIKQANGRVNQNRLSEAELIKGLDAHAANADELFLSVNHELAEALIEQLNELELPFIVRSRKVSQETYGKWNQPFQAKAAPDFMTDRKDIVEDVGRFDLD